MYVIVGLGNPGKKYENTRHNVGFMTLDRIAKKANISINQAKWNSLLGEGRYSGKKVLLVKPQTFMNRSGISVQEIVNFYKIEPWQLIVICDDIDIPFGTIRVKRKGSAGSHNGLKSIINQIASQDFPRVKISVGDCPPFMDLADFVLSKFRPDEEKILDEEIEAASQAVDLILAGHIDQAMNEYNGWIAPSFDE